MENIKFSEAFSPNKTNCSLIVKKYSISNNNPDICFVVEKDPEDQDLISHFESMNNELMSLNYEIASMHALRDLNSLENIIDYSMTPGFSQIIEYPLQWNPDIYVKVHENMEVATKDNNFDDPDDKDMESAEMQQNPTSN